MLLLLTAGTALAQFAPVLQRLRREPLPPFDRRAPAEEAANGKASAGFAAADARGAAAARLAQGVRDLRVDRDPIVDSPRFIGSPRQFLSGPAASGVTSLGATDVLAPVRTFIDANAGLFGHGSEALSRANIRRNYVTRHNGMRTVVWEQQLDGLPIFEATLHANLTARGELVNIASRFVANPEAAAGRTPGARAAQISTTEISARDAVAIAARNLGAAVVSEQVSGQENQPDGRGWRKFESPLLNGAEVRQVWLPMDANTLRLAWEVVLTSRERAEMFRVVVDASSGEPVLRHGLTEYRSNASYRVFTSDSPSPFSPGHPTPSSTQPPVVARTLVTLDALSTTASPNGWIDDGVMETRGNNVDAHADVNADNLPDLPRPQATGAARVFDPALDLAQAPSSYRDAAIVNLFYWCNWMHDQLYDLGFDEASGNFQNNNFGRGGLGNDAVQADAQDGSGTDNANFSTPPDGSPGRMQMYVFTGPTPDRDGDFDQEIILHEYTHGLSNRLVGGGVGLNALASRGMGEGWSDFYGLALLSEAGDDINGTYATGGYATYQLAGLTQNYYFGIRRYPYSTDMTKNPLTFRDIASAQASPHTGIPRSPIIGSTADEVHNSGEVWCVTLWDMRANLITKHGFAVGNRLTLQLVTDGMKLSTANPNFLQARDAILQADLVATGGANRGEIWAAFAKRGMGANATAPASTTTAGLVENFDLPDDLSISPNAIFAPTGMVGGPFTPASTTYTLLNSGTTALSWTATDTAPWLDLSATSGTLSAGASTTIVATLNTAAAALVAGNYSATITIRNATSGIAQTRAVALTVEPITVAIFADNFETGSLDPARWTVTGTSTYRTQVTTANGPHGGTRHLTMDSSVDGTYARNEATLALNLTGQTNVFLRFWAKMFDDDPNAPPSSPFTGGADFDGVAISADGNTWYEVQPLRSPAISNTWAQYTVDLDAAIAASGIAYNSNFRIRFNQYDNFTITTDGIAIDDLSVYRVVTNRLTLTAPSAVAENAGSASATLNASPTPTAPVTVTLASSAAATLSVPASVTIPAGQSSVTIPLTVTDDTVLNGTRAVTLTANAATWSPATATVDVTDDELATLSLTVPATATEGTPVTGTLSVSRAPAVAVAVQMTSTATTVATVPASVTIPAGQTSVTFPITVLDDNAINGTRPVSFTAVVANWTPGMANMSVLDNENTTLTLSVPASLREGDTNITGTARISGTLTTPLTIALSSDDTTELTVPASVTIPAGQTSATFPVTVVDDTLADGAQTVHLQATATGFTAGNATVSVADNDAHHFTVSAVASPQARNAPFTVSVTAKDVTNATITNYNSTVAFAATSGGTTVPGTPTTLSGFVNGVWTGPVTITAFATNVVLTASDTGGHMGVSNAFDVATGALHHFGWTPIASPQIANVPFNVTLSALDAGNNPVAFNGTATITGSLPGTVEVLSWTAYADVSSGGEYEHTKQAISRFFTNYHETATNTVDPAVLASELTGKHVLLIPEQELSSPSTLDGLATGWSTVLNNFVNAGGTIIVCSYATSEHLLLTRSSLLDVTPVSTYVSATIAKVADNELTTGVTAPFTGQWIHGYTTTNGTVSLQVSASEGALISRAVGAGRAILIGTDFYTLGTEYDRVIANAVQTSVSTGGGTVTVTPGSVAFSSGTWSGTLAVPSAGTGIRLRATAGAVASDSSTFNVVLPPTLALTVPSSLREGDAPTSGTVTISTALATNLVVTLSSNDTTEVTVPGNVTIPAGQRSATFTLTPMDDTLADGPQTATISASAPGATSATANVTVRDNDAHHFGFATIASPQVTNGPIPTIISARDASDNVMTDYNGTVTLSATAGGAPVTITPATSGAFASGIWNSVTQINVTASNVVISASDGNGHTGSSNAFALAAGSLSAFAWNTIASPQTVDTPFAVTVRAVDSGGTTVPAFNGLANFSMLVGGVNPPISNGTSTLYAPLYTYAHDARAQMICLASEMGGAARITALAFNLYAANNEPLTNFTIRLKPTAQANFTGSPTWDNSGWTTVYRASPTLSAAGWVTFTFTTPFDYDGTSNLMIDWSFDRTSTRSTDTYLWGISTSDPRMVYGTSNSTNGDPLTWTGTTPFPSQYYGRPNFAFTTVKEVPIRPAQSTAFSSGVWTGDVSAPLNGTLVALRARAGTVTGTSNTFDVSAAPNPGAGGAIVFSEDFETGVFSSAWTLTGTGSYRTQITTAASPHGGLRHMVMDQALDSGTYARNEATLTVNLAGRTGVQLAFWTANYGDEPEGPPPSPFPSTGADFDGVAISADGGTNWYEVQPLRGLPTTAYTPLTVDLDAAMATRGLSYSSNFKIRFNQYDNYSLGTDGIGIDDIVISARPLSGFRFVLPASATEGAGSVTGTVTLDAVRSTPTTITLGSNAPAKVTVPASVTVPAGQLSANFTFNVLDDTIVDGNRTVAISGTIAGSPTTFGNIVILDNDTTSLALSVPPTVSETAGTVNGTLTLGSVPAGTVTVNLTSSDITAATVPASVTFSAGQNVATFPITVIDDTRIDGPQMTTISATIAGGAPATATMTVTDNESPTFGLSVPATMVEGSTGTGYLSLSGSVASALTINLSSSVTSRLTVPATVQVPAGGSSAYFTITTPDNSATDGSQAVTITATATGFNTATGNVTVLDDDVHHFAFSTVASPQITSTPFTLSVFARDVNDVAVPGFAGPVAFTAAGDGGAITLTPATSGTFSSGSWTGNVTIAQADTNIRITATKAGVTGTSNAFNVTRAPTISVTPTSISASTSVGGTTTRTLTLGNTGGGDIVWSIVNGTSLVGRSEVIDSSPIFNGPAATAEKGPEPAPSQNPPYVAPRVAAPLLPDGRSSADPGAMSAAALVTLDNVLANLNANAGFVRGVIPNRYAFSEGVTGYYIIDGGNDMYDVGNMLGTSLSAGTPINYSDNTVVSSPLFGTGGRYFTRKYDGLWVFAADVAGLSYFDINGDLGADGSGSTDTTVLSLTHGGTNYRGFVKRVYNAYDPSVNHLIIVPDNGSVTHEASTSTNNDYHRVTNMTGITRVYYLLYAGNSGGYIDNTATLAIMTAFLDAVATPDWAVPTPTSGTIAAGTTQNVSLRLGSAALAAGSYTRTLLINSNDPASPSVSVPLSLTVTNVPTLDVSPGTGLASAGYRAGPFTPSTQTYTLTNPGTSAINWTAGKTAAWLDLSATGGTLAAGASATLVVSLNASAAALASGAYSDTVTLTNTTNGVGNTTRAVTLTVNAAGDLVIAPTTGLSADGLAGGPFANSTATWTLTNPGDAPLNWTAAKAQSWLTLSATGGTLAPGATATVTANINSSATTLSVGAYHDAVRFTNTTTGRGSALRNADLFVRPATPALAAEPPVTGGASNTVSWAAIAGATEYEAQAANNAAFSSPVTSGWITGTSHTFNALADGQTWYFRVRARQSVAGTTGSWTQATQAAFETGAKAGVSVTSGGEVLLTPTAGTTIAGRISNSGFETGGGGETGTIDNWTRNNSTYRMAAQLGNASTSSTVAPLPTEGSQFLMMFSYHYSYDSIPHTAGSYVRMTQTVDFTSAANLIFDANLTSYAAGVWTGVTKAEVRIDGAPVWTRTAGGSYLNQAVDVTGYTGSHTVELRQEMLTSGNHNSQWVLFDRLRLASAGGYVTSGTLTSPAIAPSPLASWGTLQFVKNVSAGGTALTVDVLDNTGALLAANVATGTDLSTITAIVGQPSLKLRANLSTTQPANTPRLTSWTVNYATSLPYSVESAWSATVNSLQDATPPAVAVTSAGTASATPFVLAGTATDFGGVSDVTVNGSTATTIDGFAHWSRSVALSSGTNTFTIVATDRATPANVRTITATVNYAPGSSSAPVITSQPTAQTANLGATATFTVAASGTPAPGYQWRKDGVPIPGANAATLTLTNVQPSEAGAYSVSVSNTAGATVSNAAALTVNVPANVPAITTQPVGQLVAAGQNVTFTVVATGAPTLSYQWRKDGAPVSGTGATLTLTSVQAAQAGAYSVVVSNGFGSATSRDATLTVIPAGFSATQMVVGPGYVPGANVVISTTLTYTGTVSALGYQMLLPAGWSYVSGGGTEGDIRPAVGEMDLLGWAWTTVPPSPVTFTTTLHVPVGTTGAQSIAGLVTNLPGPIRFVAQPDPLVINANFVHSADTDQNFRISLAELLRVIELYNTRNGTSRTGCYSVATTATEDGFEPDPTRTAAATATLGRYHSADTNRDGRIVLGELLRVIELYNYRNGTSRTGEYHLQAGTEDGYAPGP